MPALFSGEIDLIVGRLPAYRHRTKLTQEHLYNDHIVAVVGPHHALAKQKKITFEQIKPFGWILPPLETTLRRQVDQFFIDQDQYVPPLILESVAYLTNRSMLVRRELIGLLPEHVVSQDVAAGSLAKLDWSVPFGKGPVGISYRGADSLSPAGTAFVAALRNAARGLRVN
jgi:DNA-binding transcriptional LysR family regulator